MKRSCIVGIVAIFISLTAARNSAAYTGPGTPQLPDLCVLFDSDEGEFEQILREIINGGGLFAALSADPTIEDPTPVLSNQECIRYSHINSVHSFVVSDERANKIKINSLRRFSDLTVFKIGRKGIDGYIEGVVYTNIVHPGIKVQDRFVHGLYFGNEFIPGIFVFSDNLSVVSFLPGLYLDNIGFFPGLAVSSLYGNITHPLAEGFTPGMFYTKSKPGGLKQGVEKSVFRPGLYTPGQVEGRPVYGYGIGTFTPGTVGNANVFRPEAGFRPGMFQPGFEHFSGVANDMSSIDYRLNWGYDQSRNIVEDAGIWGAGAGAIVGFVGYFAGWVGDMSLGAAIVGGAGAVGVAAAGVALAVVAVVALIDWLIGDDEEDEEDEEEEEEEIVDPCWQGNCFGTGIYAKAQSVRMAVNANPQRFNPPLTEVTTPASGGNIVTNPGSGGTLINQPAISP